MRMSWLASRRSSVDSAETGPWTAHVRERICEVQAGLDSMTEWASEAGADFSTTELLSRPYGELLDTLHERDLPCAELADAPLK